MRWQAVFAALVVCLAPVAAQAAIIVNAARPITHRVTVQLIETALSNGTSPATVFGNASQRATIEAGIDKIWAQAGIDIAFLPGVVRYNNTFAYQGNGGTGVRSQADLNTMRTNAGTQGGILNANPLVLNIFMVNVVPGFAPLNEDSAAGLASIAANGIAAFAGDTLLTFQNGLDVISSVMAHEIGHNLGLNHAATGGANLMSSQGTSAQLTTTQMGVALNTTNFAQLLPAVLAGDYDNDGRVDASDYTVWRDTLNVTGSALAADGNNNGRIDAGDYSVWKTNFGQTRGSGAVTNLSVGVPEPASVVLMVVTLMSLIAERRRMIR
jgi:hypothetical protein